MAMKEIDIHGMIVSEAKVMLEKSIQLSEKNTQIRIIHGFHGGQALLNMVRKSLKHKRIKQKIIGMNNGETIFIIE